MNPIVSYIKSLPDSEVTFAGCNRFTKEFLTKHNCDMPKDESNIEYDMYIDYKGILYRNKDMNTPYAVTYQDKIELEE